MADTFTPHLNLIKPDIVKDALISDINGNMDLVDANSFALDARLDALDTNIQSLTGLACFTGGALAAGWTFQAAELRKVGKLVHFYFRVVKATTAIAAHPEGNYLNTAVGTLVAGWRPAVTAAWSTAESGMPVFGYVDAAGVAAVASGPPNIAVAIGETISGAGFWIVP